MLVSKYVVAQAASLTIDFIYIKMSQFLLHDIVAYFYKAQVSCIQKLNASVKICGRQAASRQLHGIMHQSGIFILHDVACLQGTSVMHSETKCYCQNMW